MKKWIIALCFLNVSFALVVSSPDLSVISTQKPQVQLTILNNGDKRAFVSMENELYHCDAKNIVYCLNPKIIKEQPEKSNLRFSNSKFLLDPGQKRNIFIFWRGDLPDKSIMFNAWAKDHSSDAVKTIKGKINQTTIQFDIEAVQKVRVMIAPKNTQGLKPTVIQNGGNLSIKNNGSAPLLLKYRETCDDKNCSDKRIEK
ncbi:MAG: hypothetical protein P8L77_03770, partial [Gammaproteobacteria bacterium]|nr:hypothetical protein [Gammaproteobacteria bacterium]